MIYRGKMNRKNLCGLDKISSGKHMLHDKDYWHLEMKRCRLVPRMSHKCVASL
jgi:hypothetical protein